MSHELRTPLNAIIGFSEVMRTEVFGPVGSERYREYCNDISKSGHFLLSLINDILDMSKIEAGRFRITPELVCLDAIAADTMRILSGLAAEKQITVSIMK